MSSFLPYVDVVGCEAVRRYEYGDAIAERPYSNTQRSQVEAALRTVLRRSHYLREKFVTPEFAEQARVHLADPAYGTVLFSYLYSTLLMEQDMSGRADRVYLVETHNDEFAWYRTLREATRNPLRKLTARLSEQAAARLVRAAADRAILLHVTEADHQGYEHFVPGHRYLLNRVGVEIPEAPAPPQPPGAPVRLVFVGSLGVTMNVDALRYFSERFYPVLKQTLDKRLAVDVVGSNPADAVQHLCEANDWALHANVSDEELQQRYRAATFAILPFNYATGAKLKLLESLAHGVPFLATTRVEAQVEHLHPLCFLRDALVAVAEPHAWEARARALFEGIQQVCA